MTIKKTGKYAPQETYAGKMKDKGCVRITVWVHKTIDIYSAAIAAGH